MNEDDIFLVVRNKLMKKPNRLRLKYDVMTHFGYHNSQHTLEKHIIVWREEKKRKNQTHNSHHLLLPTLNTFVSLIIGCLDIHHEENELTGDPPGICLKLTEKYIHCICFLVVAKISHSSQACVFFFDANEHHCFRTIDN